MRSQTIEQAGRFTDPNLPTPERASELLHQMDELRAPYIETDLSHNPALKALHTQTLNHIRHAHFSYEVEDGSEDYPHEFVYPDRYPARAVELALTKAREFTQICDAKDVEVTPYRTVSEEELEAVRAEQDVITGNIIADPIGAYTAFSERLVKDGFDASFPEFKSTAQHLWLRLIGGEDVEEACQDNPSMQLFRELVIGQLQDIMESGTYAYAPTILAMERAVEFFDVVQRGLHPDAPALYHSDRYEYYFNGLLARPEHVMFPTISVFGAKDLIATRGVPIGFVGIETTLSRVDGFVQTPYEFFHHDVNHSRRMFQFMSETAAAQGKSLNEFCQESSDFVRDKLVPAIEAEADDTPEQAERKTGIKMTLFEILHEDALAADPHVIHDAILRPELHRTPFERIEGDRVVYFMEPGATTLAYVFRKLSHTFYDTPDKRSEGLGDDAARSRLAVVRAATDLFKIVSKDEMNEEQLVKMLEQLVATDEGFPEAFFQEVVADIEARADTTRDFSFIVSKPLTAEGAIARIQSIGKQVHSLFGYSDLGYKDEHAMLQAVSADLETKDPSHVVIAIGATPGGIGQAYELAKQKGFQTIGIVSSKSLANGGNYSPAVDDIFVVRDQEWGGYVPGTADLTPTTEVFIGASDSISAFGGGEITAVTIAEAVKRAREVRFTPAEMASSGSNPHGPAYERWAELGRRAR